MAVEARLQHMRVKLQRTASSESLISVSLLIRSQSPGETELLDSWCSSHRTTRLAIDEFDLQRWSYAQATGDMAQCSGLLRNTVILWDRPFCCRATGNGRYLWQEEIPNTVISQCLLDRLQWAETADEVAVNIEQLMLEQQLVFSSEGCEAAKPIPLLALPPGRHHVA